MIGHLCVPDQASQRRKIGVHARLHETHSYFSNDVIPLINAVRSIDER